jgi:phage antirepressor protein
MEDLIKVSINESNEQIVSGRELYEFLEVKTKYKDWIKRKIEKYEFIENIDFVLVAQKRATNNPRNPYTLENEHILKLSMAKELAMLENNEKGKQARLYFIKCEEEYKKQKQVTFSRKELLQLKVINANTENERMLALSNYEDEYVKPLEVEAKYTKEVLKSDSLLTVSQIAKDLGLSAIKLNKLLESLDIQYKKGGKWYIKAKYQDKGYAQYDTTLISDNKTVHNLKWTEKGKKFIIEILDKEYGIKLNTLRLEN